ncbi:hypothetical protein Bbelb_350680 [Branchiostoma belcheri]|nr:hypothetical protein Bbelb_350680 [Branchiostoma belcheri]
MISATVPTTVMYNSIVMPDMSFRMARLRTISGPLLKAAASGRVMDTTIAFVDPTDWWAIPMLTRITPTMLIRIPQIGMRPIFSFKKINPKQAVNKGMDP